MDYIIECCTTTGTQHTKTCYSYVWYVKDHGRKNHGTVHKDEDSKMKNVTGVTGNRGLAMIGSLMRVTEKYAVKNGWRPFLLQVLVVFIGTDTKNIKGPDTMWF